jgi:signal recognition particle subunit SRP54
LNEVAKEIQKALIVSDVNLNLILELSKKIKSLKGEKMPEGVDEKEYIVKRIYDLLIELFEIKAELPQKPKRILLCGLFGSGKTTTSC